MWILNVWVVRILRGRGNIGGGGFAVTYLVKE